MLPELLRVKSVERRLSGARLLADEAAFDQQAEAALDSPFGHFKVLRHVRHALEPRTATAAPGEPCVDPKLNSGEAVIIQSRVDENRQVFSAVLNFRRLSHSVSIRVGKWARQRQLPGIE